MARYLRARYVRHRHFNRIRHSTAFKGFLAEQADRLASTEEDVFNLMKQGYTADQIRGLGGIPAAPVNTVAPSISGTPTVGEELTAANGTWTGYPAPGYSYQWNRDSAAISGATAANYTLVGADEGTNITVTVTASNSEGSASETSGPVGPVAPAPAAPVNTAAPVISGTPTVGQELSCTTGTWTGNPTPTYAYEWQADGTPIAGATSSTYTLQAAEEGTTITCEVTATNSAGSASEVSNSLGPVAAA